MLYQELMSAAKRREGTFNCAYRAVTASSKVIRHSMSILGLSVGYVIRMALCTDILPYCTFDLHMFIRRAAHTIEVLAIYGHSTTSTLDSAVTT